MIPVLRVPPLVDGGLPASQGYRIWLNSILTAGR